MGSPSVFPGWNFQQSFVPKCTASCIAKFSRPEGLFFFLLLQTTNCKCPWSTKRDFRTILSTNLCEGFQKSPISLLPHQKQLSSSDLLSSGRTSPPDQDSLSASPHNRKQWHTQGNRRRKNSSRPEIFEPRFFSGWFLWIVLVFNVQIFLHWGERERFGALFKNTLV